MAATDKGVAVLRQREPSRSSRRRGRHHDAAAWRCGQALLRRILPAASQGALSSTAQPFPSTTPAKSTRWRVRMAWPSSTRRSPVGSKALSPARWRSWSVVKTTALESARPVLEPMAGKIIHCGAGGAGQAAKVCNNMVLAVHQIAIGEAFVLAEKLGLSPQALFDVITGATGNCWAVHTNCPVPGPVPTSPANNDFKPGFATALMNKDLGLAMDALSSTGSAAPLGSHAAEIYAKFAAAQGDKDFSAVIEMLAIGRSPDTEAVQLYALSHRLPPPVDSSTLHGLTRAERVPSAGGRETGTDRGAAGFFRQHHPNDSARPQGGGVRLELHAASPSVVARVSRTPSPVAVSRRPTSVRNSVSRVVTASSSSL